MSEPFPGRKSWPTHITTHTEAGIIAGLVKQLELLNNPNDRPLLEQVRIMRDRHRALDFLWVRVCRRLACDIRYDPASDRFYYTQFPAVYWDKKAEELRQQQINGGC